LGAPSFPDSGAHEQTTLERAVRKRMVGPGQTIPGTKLVSSEEVSTSFHVPTRVHIQQGILAAQATINK